MFRSEEEGYYSAYVNSYNSENVSKKAKRNGKPVRRNMKKKRTREELYNRIKADFKDINDPKFNKVLKAYLDAHMVNGVCFRKCAEGYLNDMQLYDEVLSAAVPDICQKEYDFSERGAQKLTSITDLLSYPQYYDEHFKSQLTEYSVQSSRIKAAHAYLLKSLKTIPQYIVIENLMDSIKVLLEFVQNKTAENSYIEGAEAAYRIIKEKYSEIEIDYDFEHRSLPKVSETKILPEDYYIESEFLDRLNKMFKSE